jgi:hypothetical protein
MSKVMLRGVHISEFSGLEPFMRDILDVSFILICIVGTILLIYIIFKLKRKK